MWVQPLPLPLHASTATLCVLGWLQVSPIGRNCSQEEREEFEKFDLKEGIRCTLKTKKKTETRHQVQAVITSPKPENPKNPKRINRHQVQADTLTSS